MTDTAYRLRSLWRRLADLRIRSKLILGFAFVVAILLAAGLLGLSRLEAEMRTLIGESSLSTARSITQQLERSVYDRLETMRELALTTPRIEIAVKESNLRTAEGGSPSAIRNLIDRRDRTWSEWVGAGDGAGPMPPFMAEVERHPVSAKLRYKLDFYEKESGHRVFSEIFVTNRFGANVAQTGLTSDFRQDDEDWWNEAWREGVAMGEVDFDDSSGVYSIELALAVDDSSGDRLGVMKAVLDIEEIRQVLARFEALITEDGGQIEVVDRRGMKIYPRFEPDEAPAALPEEGYRLAAGDGESERLYASVRTAGHERYPDLDWALRLSFPRDTVFRPILVRRRQLLALGAVVIALALAVATLISLSLTRPIEEAARASEAMARGELRIDLAAHGGGEARQLLEALSAMVAEIRRTVESLVHVSERIRSLAAALSETGTHIAEGARNQTRARDGGNTAVAAMAESMKEVALISDKMRSEVFETSAAIEEMATSTEIVARNAVQLSRGVGETLRAVRHLAESIEGVAGRARQAEDASHRSLEEARSGGDAVRRTIAEMDAVNTSIDEVVAVVERLRTSGQRIDQATEIIEDIAKQTNLLALNAAIEAANAGEHGRGFAIVADEVQRLARQSAGSTREIAALVEEVQTEAEAARRISQEGAETARHGLDLARQAGSKLDSIVEAAAQVNDGLLEIRRAAGDQAGVADELVSTFEQMQNRTLEVEQATGEQAAGSERIREALTLLTDVAHQVGGVVRNHRRDGQQVDEAMAHISRITAENAETAEEIVTATAALEAAAEELRALAAFFKLG